MPKIETLVNVGIEARHAKAIAAGNTGEVRFGFWDNASSAPEGWLWLNGETIAKGGVSADHASDTLEKLYVHLWTVISDTYAPVSTGRGSTALADFQAGKTLTLPNSAGRMPIAKAASGTASALGETGGAIDHSHSVPAHYHGVGTGADINITSSGTHNHGVYTKNTLGGTGDTGGFAAKGKDGTSTCVDAITSTTGAHTHAVGNFSGRIGLVTGGVDGNSAMTSGTTNPPFLVLVAMVAL